MMIGSNFSITSLKVSNRLVENNQAVAKIFMPISSGSRINSAKDDSAGLQITNRLNSQINSAAVLKRNANDGISIIQTAEAALSESTNILHRLRELSVYAANGSHSNKERESIQKEVAALNIELTNIAKNTSFSGENLLDGSFTNNLGISETPLFNTRLNISSASPEDLIVKSKYENIGSHAGKINTRNPDNVINALRKRAASQNFHFQSNGTSTKAITYNYSTAIFDIATKINDALKEADINISASSSNTLYISDFGSDNSSGILRIATGKGRDDNVAFHMNNYDLSDLSTLADDINSRNISRLSASTSEDNSTLVLNSDDDISIRMNTGSVNLKNAQGSSVTSNSSKYHVAVGIISLTGSDAFTMLGADEKLFAQSNALSNNSSLIDILDTSTQLSAQESISAIDTASDKILQQRTDLGAQQNALAHTINNLENMRSNLTHSKGRILDTDYAKQTSKMVKSKLLYESSLSLINQMKTLSAPALQLLSSEPILSNTGLISQSNTYNS